MPFDLVTILIIAGCVAFVKLIFALLFIRWARRHEPYSSFLQLRNGQKLAFFKCIMADRSVPFYVKFIPVIVILYAINPLDLIPLPIIGQIDDLAIILAGLGLVLKLTPRSLLDNLMERVTRSH